MSFSPEEAGMALLRWATQCGNGTVVRLPIPYELELIGQPSNAMHRLLDFPPVRSDLM